MNKALVFEHVEIILFFFTIALVTNWIGAARGFFRIPSHKNIPIPVSFWQVLVVFLIYIGTMAWLGYYIAILIQNSIANLELSSPTVALGLYQITLTLISAVLLFLFIRSQPREMWRRIWKDRTRSNPSSIRGDLGVGFAAWFLSFPLILALGQLCDLILYLVYGVVNYEQVAVRYLKTTIGSPAMITLALLLILVAAPTIEEILFRGFLQSWLRKHLGKATSICISSLLFSCFHFSSSQGSGNFSLIVPLFAFGCYLGFVYERQGSLYASIALHATFNAVSSYRILLIPDQS